MTYGIALYKMTWGITLYINCLVLTSSIIVMPIGYLKYTIYPFSFQAHRSSVTWHTNVHLVHNVFYYCTYSLSYSVWLCVICIVYERTSLCECSWQRNARSTTNATNSLHTYDSLILWWVSSSFSHACRNASRKFLLPSHCMSKQNFHASCKFWGVTLVRVGFHFFTVMPYLEKCNMNWG